MRETTDRAKAQFQTTSWSLVLAAAQHPATVAEAALARLCGIYWYPVYAFVRRRGYSVDDASDLTQEFFSRVIEHNYLAAADRDRGRFRSFLLAAVRHFLANHWHREHAQKRGGGTPAFSLDTNTAERRYVLEPVDTESPERLYARRWGLALLDQVMTTLRNEYAVDGKLDQFDKLEPLLAGHDDLSYAEIAAQWSSTEGAVRVAVHRARKKYRSLLRRMVADTLLSPSEIDDEIRFLATALERQK